MRLEAKRSGGVAGINQQAGPVDTDNLKGAIAGALQHAVDQARFFELPASLPDVNRVFDAMAYSITVSDDARTHTVSWTDAAAHEDLVPLGELREMIANAAGGFHDIPWEAERS